MQVFLFSAKKKSIPNGKREEEKEKEEEETESLRFHSVFKVFKQQKVIVGAYCTLFSMHSQRLLFSLP